MRNLLAIFVMLLPWGLHAQDPNLAPDNLKFTGDVVNGNHLIATGSMLVDEGKFVHFRYDRYPEMRKVTTEDGVAYAQEKGKAWLKSNDWGKTGTPVKKEKIQELENYIAVAESPLAPFVSHDQSQGGAAWKAIEQKKEGDLEYFTYERSREHPKADGVYPRFTFIKYAKDTDGKLLLEHFTAQMRSGEKVIPVEVKFGFMFLIPNANVTVEDAPAKKKKK